MIDRHARDMAADALRDLIQGSISNREYERRFPKSDNDPALRAIFSNIWFCYSDLAEHTLKGKHEPTDEQRAILNRCLLFLRGDLEFQWPPPKFRVWYGILRLLGLGRMLRQQELRQLSIGDIDVWPFLNKTDYYEVLRESNNGRS